MQFNASLDRSNDLVTLSLNTDHQYTSYVVCQMYLSEVWGVVRDSARSYTLERTGSLKRSTGSAIQVNRAK